MPLLKDRHLVISRSRDYRDTYETVCEWLNTTNYFKWTDDSVTYNDQLERLDLKRRKLLLHHRIEQCNCVVLFAEMYEGYQEWIDLAIDMANELHKPIIGVKSRDDTPTPKRMQINCRAVAKWQNNSIVAAIQEHSL